MSVGQIWITDVRWVGFHPLRTVSEEKGTEKVVSKSEPGGNKRQKEDVSKLERGKRV